MNVWSVWGCGMSWEIQAHISVWPYEEEMDIALVVIVRCWRDAIRWLVGLGAGVGIGGRRSLAF